MMRGGRTRSAERLPVAARPCRPWVGSTTASMPAPTTCHLPRPNPRSSRTSGLASCGWPPSGTSGAAGARGRGAARPTGRRRHSRRSSWPACCTSPTATAATAVPTREPIPPMTTTMNAKMSSDSPWAGETDLGTVRRGFRRARRPHRRSRRRSQRALDVDAERLHHGAVLDPGPDDQAEVRVKRSRARSPAKTTSATTM